VAEVGPDLNLVTEHPKSNSNIDNFNPHGRSSLIAATTENESCTLQSLHQQ
jgi:hypothetical protein